MISAHSMRASLVADSVNQFDQLVRDYNLLAFHNATFAGGQDIEGAVAVGGNLYVGQGNDIGAHAVASAGPTLYVAGTNGLHISSGTVNLQNGYAALPGDSTSKYSWNSTGDKLSYKPSGNAVQGVLSTVNSNDPIYNVSNGADNPKNFNPQWNFASLQTSFETISNTLAGAAVNGHISVVGQTLVFSANAGVTSGPVVFDLNVTGDLSSNGTKYKGTFFSQVKFNVPAGYEYVVNVLNANNQTLFTSANFNAGSGYDHLLWNFVDAPNTLKDTVTVNGFYGAVLAPTYTLDHHSGTAMNGQLVVDNLDYSCSELHFTTFDELPATPEPSTYGVVGAAALLGLAAWRRKKSKNQQQNEK